MNEQSVYILKSGESITAREVFEAFILMAMAETSHPLITTSDRRIAVIEMAFQALDWAEENV